eukprot:gene15005-16554_t
MFPHGLMTSLLKEVNLSFRNEGWKQDPTVKHFGVCNYECQISKLETPHCCHNSNAIEMMEDYNCENQQLYSAKDVALKTFLDCLRKVLYVLEPFPDRIDVGRSGEGKWDATVRQLIQIWNTKAKSIQGEYWLRISVVPPTFRYQLREIFAKFAEFNVALLEFHDGEEEVSGCIRWR